MKVEIKLIDGTGIVGDHEFLNTFKRGFYNGAMSSFSMLKVNDVHSNQEYFFPMTSVVYARELKEDESDE
ncbi:hypothetical protein [Paenibacillus donghaensis]|uniref:Uncharacterized protein n=1 Tax=Paenibacillus donghaensis TaxID=414771 RepID=A0A2Z2K4R9_9BACL|nr:hypothetical protein [Paenibacillus donghaensis]ASA20936.1 hypothetical protein B9T62_09155 [Paenibacillus donghaensis]